MRHYKLNFTPEAHEDVTGAAAYYNRQLPGLGKLFKQEVKKQLRSIKQDPFARAIRYDKVRFAVLNTFPYSVHYSIDGNIVNVHAVICQYRDPMEFWITR